MVKLTFNKAKLTALLFLITCAVLFVNPALASNFGPKARQKGEVEQFQKPKNLKEKRFPARATNFKVLEGESVYIFPIALDIHIESKTPALKDEAMSRVDLAKPDIRLRIIEELKKNKFTVLNEPDFIDTLMDVSAISDFTPEMLIETKGMLSQLSDQKRSIFMDGRKTDLGTRKIDFGSGELRRYLADKNYVLFLVIQTQIKTVDILQEEYDASIRPRPRVDPPGHTWSDFARAVLLPVVEAEISSAINGKVITEPARSAYINATLLDAKTGTFLFYQNIIIEPSDLANPSNLNFFLENAFGEMK